MKRMHSLLTRIALLALLGASATAFAAGGWQLQQQQNGGGHHHGRGNHGGPPVPGPAAGTVQNLTLSNLGDVPLDHIAIRFTGSNSRDFSQTNNCGLRLDGGGSCVISVTFRPASTGPKNSTLEIHTSGGNKSVDLSGTGT